MADCDILTIGHSTHPIDEFIEILLAHQIKQIVDVRTVPRSRHNPQFNRDVLPPSLDESGIAYIHFAALGGLRHAKKDSINMAWKNASFRGYADYMQTAEFEQGLEELIKFSSEARTAIMCAEAVPWRCHRSMIADALNVRGLAVCHILSKNSANPHKMTSFALVRGTSITYPAVEP